MGEALGDWIALGLVWGLLPGVLAWVAATDWRERRIANEASATLLIGFVGLALATAMPPTALLIALSCGLAAFAFGFVLFALGQMGPGDVKLLAALAPWFGADPALLDMVVRLAIAGGALTLAFLALRTLRTRGAVASVVRQPHRGTWLAAIGVPVLVTLCLALGVEGRAVAWLWKHAADLPATLVPFATLSIALLFAAALLIALFSVLEMLGRAPALAVPDPERAGPPPGGLIETPYGIAIAAAALTGLPALAALHA